MVEIGRDTPYVEHWVRGEEVDALAGAIYPTGALRLRGRDDGCEAYLVRAGEWFAFARNRIRPLASGSSLADEIARASLDDARALVDCEISVGRVSPQGWRIFRSSLPFREGRLLFAAPDANAEKFVTWDVSSLGEDVSRHWLVMEAEGALMATAATPRDAGSPEQNDACASRG